MLKVLSDLFKIKITLLVAITTAFGYVIYEGKAELQMIFPVLGIFLLACGSAAINQIQERDIDPLMSRTKNRPLALGSLTLKWAVIIVVFIVSVATLILYLYTGWLVTVLGWAALVWYNLIYTPLKKINAFAVIPGSIIGSIPPVAGWVAAGGEITDPKILVIALFFFIWQIPHFWMLLLFLNTDYQKSGLPTIKEKFSDAQLARITFTWTFATGFTTLLFPVFGITHSVSAIILVALSSAALVIYAVQLLKTDAGKSVFRKNFAFINIFVLLIVFIISVDNLLTTTQF